jgi:RHH-type transcriptional regulator, rel operon repressor / antitoxin RelB
MSMMTFRVEDEVKARLDSVVSRLGLNQSRILRDAVVEKIEELEELATVMERIKDKRPRRPIAQLWKELGLENPVRPKVRKRS